MTNNDKKTKSMTDIETQKNGYFELINLCLGDSKKKVVISFIDTLRNYNGDENFYTTLNYVKDYLDNNEIHFIMALDWKQEITALVWRINSSMKDNFNESIELPNPEVYGKNKSVSYKNVFIDFDNAVNKKGYKLGFINTDGDEYVIIVHKTADEKEVENAISKIGYNYLTASSSLISPKN